MTIKEKLEQEQIQKQEKIKSFEEQEDGIIKISKEEAKEWEENSLFSQEDLDI